MVELPEGWTWPRTERRPTAPYQPETYQELVRKDFIQMMGQAVQKGQYRIRDSDGKLEANMGMSTEAPWHHVKHVDILRCDLWHQIMFDLIGPNLPQRFVPSQCFHCWKVVVRPKTIVQLYKLLDLQKQMDVPSKCGIEKRVSVPALYGGYFYNIGLEAGLARYTEVKDKVADLVGANVPVILKRACTEYELACGPSNTWKVQPWQIPIEEMVNHWIASDGIRREQPPLVIWHIHRQWIEWAHEHGDMTYLELTEDGKPLYPPSMTYHHLVDARPEEKRALFAGGTDIDGQRSSPVTDRPDP